MKGSICIGEFTQYGEAARAARGGLERGGDEGEGADDVLSMVGVGVGGEAGDEALDEGVGGEGGVGGGWHCCEWKVRVTYPDGKQRKDFLLRVSGIPTPTAHGESKEAEEEGINPD